MVCEFVTCWHLRAVVLSAIYVHIPFWRESFLALSLILIRTVPINLDNEELMV